MLCTCYSCALDAEVSKYVAEAYPKGVCSVYCTSGKDVEEPGFDFELVVLITATRLSPQNFWYVDLQELLVHLISFLLRVLLYAM